MRGDFFKSSAKARNRDRALPPDPLLTGRRGRFHPWCVWKSGHRKAPRAGSKLADAAAYHRASSSSHTPVPEDFHVVCLFRPRRAPTVQDPALHQRRQCLHPFRLSLVKVSLLFRIAR